MCHLPLSASVSGAESCIGLLPVIVILHQFRLRRGEGGREGGREGGEREGREGAGGREGEGRREEGGKEREGGRRKIMIK